MVSFNIPFLFIKFEKMIGSKAIQVTVIVGVLIIFYDARYLLVNVERGNGRGLQGGIIKPLARFKGNIAPMIFFNI